MGCRYCRIRSTRCSSSIASTATAPGWSMNSRASTAPPYSNSSSTTSQILPSCSTRDDRTGTSAGSSASSCVSIGYGSSIRSVPMDSGIDGLRDLEQPARLLPVERRLDESAEQRVRTVRPRPQLRVRLRADVVGMLVAGQLYELDQGAVRGGSGEHQACLRDLLAIGVVDLVAV